MPSDRVLSCADVAEALPGIVDGPGSADLALRRHVEGCLRCQAELVQYRRLLRALHHLRTEVLEPAPGLLDRDPRQPRGGGRARRGALAAERPAGRLSRRAGGGHRRRAAAGAIVLANRARKRVRLAS